MWHTVKIRAERYDAVVALAASEDRSVAKMVDRLLERALGGAGPSRVTVGAISGAAAAKPDGEESREVSPASPSARDLEGKFRPDPRGDA